jgi:hypothetical protein
MSSIIGYQPTNRISNDKLNGAGKFSGVLYRAWRVLRTSWKKIELRFKDIVDFSIDVKIITPLFSPMNALSFEVQWRIFKKRRRYDEGTD